MPLSYTLFLPERPSDIIGYLSSKKTLECIKNYFRLEEEQILSDENEGTISIIISNIGKNKELIDNAMYVCGFGIEKEIQLSEDWLELKYKSLSEDISLLKILEINNAKGSKIKYPIPNKKRNLLKRKGEAQIGWLLRKIGFDKWQIIYKGTDVYGIISLLHDNEEIIGLMCKDFGIHMEEIERGAYNGEEWIIMLFKSKYPTDTRPNSEKWLK